MLLEACPPIFIIYLFFFLAPDVWCADNLSEFHTHAPSFLALHFRTTTFYDPYGLINDSSRLVRLFTLFLGAGSFPLGHLPALRFIPKLLHIELTSLQN